MATAQRGQYVGIVPTLTAIDRLFDEHDTIRGQHCRSELAKLVAQLRLGKRLLKIASMAGTPLPANSAATGKQSLAKTTIPPRF